MKFVQNLALLCIALIAVVVLVTAEPNGAYCGSYMGSMVTGKAVMNSKSHSFDLNVKAFGKSFSCEDIKFELNGKEGHVLVPDAMDAKSCLGDMLHSNGLSLDVSYDLRHNKVTLDLGVTKLDLKSC